MTITRIGNGAYLASIDGRSEVVYVAGTPGNRWAFWNGRVFHGPFDDTPDRRPTASPIGGAQALSAPMPATVLQVLVQPGDVVKSGDTLVILEAMKMELPLRATAAATVKAVHCREGELVQPAAILVELE